MAIATKLSEAGVPTLSQLSPDQALLATTEQAAETTADEKKAIATQAVVRMLERQMDECPRPSFRQFFAKALRQLGVDAPSRRELDRRLAAQRNNSVSKQLLREMTDAPATPAHDTNQATTDPQEWTPVHALSRTRRRRNRHRGPSRLPATTTGTETEQLNELAAADNTNGSRPTSTEASAMVTDDPTAEPNCVSHVTPAGVRVPAPTIDEDDVDMALDDDTTESGGEVTTGACVKRRRNMSPGRNVEDGQCRESQLVTEMLRGDLALQDDEARRTEDGAPTAATMVAAQLTIHETKQSLTRTAERHTSSSSAPRL